MDAEQFMDLGRSGTQGLSFGEIADRYDRFRPGVPAPALDWLLSSDCNTVVDLAAGTGALTRCLVDRVPNVVAVEPDPRMLEILARSCPESRPLRGTAEQMPLPNGYADAVLISMAWHWMDARAAVAEIARVLRCGGTFGVLWNHRDLSVPWVAELDRFTREARALLSGRDPAKQVAGSHVMDPPTGTLFSPLAELRLTWSMTVTAEELVGLLGTDASACTLPAKIREAADEQVAEYVRDELGVSGDRTIDLPVAVRCLRTTRNSDTT